MSSTLHVNATKSGSFRDLESGISGQGMQTQRKKKLAYLADACPQTMRDIYNLATHTAGSEQA